MLGNIIGDVAGSIAEVREMNAKKASFKVPYEERIKILDKSAPLFEEGATITDDTVLTIAVMDKLINQGTYEEKFRYYGNKELEIGLDQRGMSSFGSFFETWLRDDIWGKMGTSYGNGASMRVAPIAYLSAYLGENLDLVTEEITLSCRPTHNNEEAIRCALMVGAAVFYAKNCFPKKTIQLLLQNYEYKIDYDLEYLQKNYIFSSRSSLSVPIAISVFLQSDNFEDAIRKAISVGGDTDTIACIVGGLAESYYGLDKDLAKQVKPYIKEYMHPIVDKYYRQVNQNVNK